MTSFDTIFTMSSSNIKYGRGATAEVGYDMQALGCKRVMVVTDPYVSTLPCVEIAMQSLIDAGIEAHLYNQVKIEPTDASFKHGIEFANQGNFDGFVSVGGGSSIDTAKIANLYSTHPDDFLAYVNQPLGQGKQIPDKVKPHIAIPTTAGTGSETTGVAIFDFVELQVKTGISHAYLRPNLGIIDPDNTRTVPPMVAASCGLDVFCHAIESLTAIDYDQRIAPESPRLRPPYQGSNPISDMWASQAVKMVWANMMPAITDAENDEARANMMLASTYAGIGFGNAGVHLPHAMAYPIAGAPKRDYKPDGYRTSKKSLIPHGISVILSAPAVFRWTAQANPEKHLYVASLMGADVSHAKPDDAGDILADLIVEMMQQTKIPNGLNDLGFTSDDIPALVKGTQSQARLTKMSPRQASDDDLARLFEASMTIW